MAHLAGPLRRPAWNNTAPMTLLRRPTATPGADGARLRVTPDTAGWQYVHFAAHQFAPGERLAGESRANEVALVVLGGRCSVEAAGQTFAHVGERADVWTR